MASNNIFGTGNKPNLFSNQNTQQKQPAGGLFNNTNQPQQQNNIFGGSNTNTSTSNPTGNPFNTQQPSTNSSTPGIFSGQQSGSTNPPAQGGIFGNVNKPT